MPEDTTLPNADAGPVDCHVRPDSPEWVRAWFAEHYNAADVFYDSAEAITLDGAVAFASAVAIAERERLRALLEDLRDANCAAQGVEFFQLLTPRQEKAWGALRAALS